MASYTGTKHFPKELLRKILRAKGILLKIYLCACIYIYTKYFVKSLPNIFILVLTHTIFFFLSNDGIHYCNVSSEKTLKKKFIRLDYGFVNGSASGPD